MFGNTDRACLAGWRIATLAALSSMAFTLMALASVGAAQAETRYLKFYNLHTHEKAVFPYKVSGRYVSSEMKKVNYFLRDWRKNQATTMDPQLLDLIWEAYRQSGSNGYINVICGYRSPGTNNMLRTRSRNSGVAQESQHTLGKALDFYIPDVPLKKMREIGLRMQVGGVGYYPTSGSPFVHFDVGRARHWPRMSRSQLLAVFPNGNTVHVPSDGKPLPGYQQALASYKQRRGASDIQVANAGGGRSSGGGKTLLSFLFGGGSDEADDEADTEVTPAAAPARQAPPVRQVPARQTPAAEPEPQVAVAAVVPQSRPTVPGGIAVAVADSFDTSRPAAIAPEKAAPTQMAMLEPSNVPFPTFAPSRQIAAVSAAPSVASLAAKPSTAKADADTVSALVADLEAQDEAETRDKQAVAGDQLAYAVPTPRERPAFDAVLATASAAPAAIPNMSSKGGILAVADKIQAGEARSARGLNEDTAIRVASIAPTPQPAPAGRTAVQAAAAKALITEVAVVAPRPSKASSVPRSTFASVLLENAAGAPNGSKGGRVRGTKTASKIQTKAPAATQQDLISSRIELASLVTDPDQRAGELRTSTPTTDRLVGNVPDTLYAAGFSAPAAASSASGRSDRFSGTAVTFMPVVKLNP